MAAGRPVIVSRSSALNDGGTTDSVRTLPWGRSAGRAYRLRPPIPGSRPRGASAGLTGLSTQVAWCRDRHETTRTDGLPGHRVHAELVSVGLVVRTISVLGCCMGVSRRTRRLSTSAALALILALAGAASPVTHPGGPGSPSAAALADATFGPESAQPNASVTVVEPPEGQTPPPAIRIAATGPTAGAAVQADIADVLLEAYRAAVTRLPGRLPPAGEPAGGDRPGRVGLPRRPPDRPRAPHLGAGPGPRRQRLRRDPGHRRRALGRRRDVGPRRRSDAVRPRHLEHVRCGRRRGRGRQPAGRGGRGGGHRGVPLLRRPGPLRPRRRCGPRSCPTTTRRPTSDWC